MVRTGYWWSEEFPGPRDLPEKVRYGAYGEDIELPLPGDYMGFNRVLGGIRFRQEVGEATPSFDYCLFPTTQVEGVAEGVYKKPCTPAISPHFYVGPEYAHGEAFREHADGYAGNREEWLLLSESYQASEMLTDMEDGCRNLEHKGRGKNNGTTECLCRWCAEQSPMQPWVDERTERIEITTMLYNPQYGSFLIVGANFWFNQGGHIHKMIPIQSSWADPFHTSEWYIFA